MNGLTIIGTVALSGGRVCGSGTVIGDVQNDGAIVAPGHSAGAFAVTGDFTQSTNGSVILEAAGGLARQFEKVEVGANASLGGTLQFHTFDGYVPLPEDGFQSVRIRDRRREF